MFKMNIVLLRGLIRESRHWSHFKDDLQSQFPEARIVTPEIAGTGKFYDKPSATSIDTMVEDLREQTKEYLGENTHLIAISMGGMIGTAWGQKYPKDFSSATFMNTSYKNCSFFYERFSLKYTPKLFFAKLFLPIEKRERIILSISANTPKAIEDNIQNWITIQQTSPISNSNALKQIGAAFLFKAKDEKLKFPVLVIASKNDRLVSVNCSVKIAKKYDYPIIFHETAGHGIDMDDPDWVASQISHWIHGLK